MHNVLKAVLIDILAIIDYTQFSYIQNSYNFNLRLNACTADH